MDLAAINACDIAVILDADHKIAAVGIGKSHYVDCQSFSIDPDTFPVKSLPFRHRTQDIYIMIHHVLSAPPINV